MKYHYILTVETVTGLDRVSRHLSISGLADGGTAEEIYNAVLDDAANKIGTSNLVTLLFQLRPNNLEDLHGSPF